MNQKLKDFKRELKELLKKHNAAIYIEVYGPHDEDEGITLAVYDEDGRLADEDSEFTIEKDRIWSDIL